MRTPSLADQIATFDYRVFPPSAATGGLPVKIIVAGDPNQKDLEAVVAYEAGYRAQFTRSVALDVAVFRNHYTHLTSFTRGPATFAVDNGIPHLRLISTHAKLAAGETYGMESLVNWTPTSRWLLSSSVTLLDADLRITDPTVDPGNSLLVLLAHPRAQFTARSSIQLARAFEFDATVLWNGPWQTKEVEGYWRTDLRAGWDLGRGVMLDAGVQNLFNDRHRETALYLYHTPTEIARSAYARFAWRF